MFPNATLIADRFHVQRLVLWAMERVRKDIQNTFPKTSPYLKHNKRILQKRGTTLSGEELVKLRCILSQSDELRRAYILKEAFYKVLRQKTELAAKRELNKWLAMVMGYNLDAFKGILRSFKDWEAAIIQAIIQPYSNGFTEGCNNLIKTVKRVAFGMRDFNRFRNRILYVNWQKGTRQMPCRVPKRRFSCGAPQHLTKNPFSYERASWPIKFYSLKLFLWESHSIIT